MRMRRFRAYGVFMLVGVVLHLVVIWVLMVPSFVAAFVPMVASQVSLSVVVAFVHAGLGVAAAVLGVWLVAGWRLRRSLDYCMPKKRWMRGTFYVWFGALILGFVLYLSLFWNSLFG